MGPGKRIEALSMAGRFRRIQCEPIEHGKSPRVHPRSADPPSQDEFCRGVECVTGETRDYFESCGIRSAAPPGALVFKYSPGTECRAHIASCREPRHERHQSAGLRYDESHFNGHSSIGMFPRRRDFFPLRQAEYLLFGNTQCGLPILPELPELGGYIDHIDGGIQISKDSNSRETLMIRITCDTCGVVRNPGQRGWILGYDLGFDSSDTITRSISFFDRWDDSRILERGMIQFCSPECKQAYIAANTLKRRGAGKSVSLRRRGSRAA